MIKIVGIERHEYAPELNKIHLSNGKVVPAPGCVTIVQANKVMNAYIEGLSDRPEQTPVEKLLLHLRGMMEQEENEHASAAYLRAMLAVHRHLV